MLALYRCGRRSEALQAYRDGRTLLIEETGLEPGERLRDLHEAILRDEVAPWRAEPEPPPNPPEPEPTVETTRALKSAPVRGAAAVRGPATAEPSGPVRAEAPAPVPGNTVDAYPAWVRGPVVPRLGVGVVLLLVALVCLGGATAEPSSQALGEASSQGRQLVPGPAWVNGPPRPVPRAFFGATIGTNSGAMPGFRIGSVRWARRAGRTSSRAGTGSIGPRSTAWWRAPDELGFRCSTRWG